MKKGFKKGFIAWFTVAGLEFLLVIIQILPKNILYLLGNGLSRIYYILAMKNRKIALSNIEKALGTESNHKQRIKILGESFKTMSHIILDTLRFSDLSDGKASNTISIEGIENLQHALKKGHGVIAVSAHLGSFTIMGSGLIARGYKTSFVARHARNEGVERIVMDICKKIRQKIIFSRPIYTCIKLCIKALKRNEIVIIEMDQNFGTEGIRMKFFGHSAMVASGPVKLAMKTQAAILPMFIIRINDLKHTIKIEPEIKLEKFTDVDMQVRNNLQKVCAVIESYIRKYPGQWVNWIHKEWDAI